MTEMTTNMKYGRVTGIDKPVSRLVQGTMMISSDRQAEGDELLDTVVELGCTALDSGLVYGNGASERCIGNWMQARGNREEMVIMTKGCHPGDGRKRVTPEDLDSDLSRSLDCLQTDYVDLYVLHRDDPAVPVGPIVETLNRHASEGRIRAFGGSNWTHQRVAEANEYAASCGLRPFTVTSPNFSLAVQVQSPWGDDCVSISGPQCAAARDWYREHNMPVFAWSSMARGFFSGRWSRENYAGMRDTPDGSSVHAYCHEDNFRRLDRVKELAELRGVSIARIALAWVLQQSLDIYALVGCYNRAEFADCAAALSLGLTDAELAWLDLRA